MMSNERERISAEMLWWRTYCEAALILAKTNDALKMLSIPLNEKQAAIKLLDGLVLR